MSDVVYEDLEFQCQVDKYSWPLSGHALDSSEFKEGQRWTECYIFICGEPCMKLDRRPVVSFDMVVFRVQIHGKSNGYPQSYKVSAFDMVSKPNASLCQCKNVSTSETTWTTFSETGNTLAQNLCLRLNCSRNICEKLQITTTNANLSNVPRLSIQRLPLA